MVGTYERSRDSNGRQRKQNRPHEKAHEIINDDCFGRPAFIEGGAVPLYFSLPKCQRRNRMGPTMFTRLLEKIKDPETGHEEF